MIFVMAKAGSWGAEAPVLRSMTPAGRIERPGVAVPHIGGHGMGAVGPRKALDGRYRRCGGKAAAQLGARHARGSGAADHARQVIGAERFLAHPDGTRPGEPLAPARDIAPGGGVLAGERKCQRILAVLRRHRSVTRPAAGGFAAIGAASAAVTATAILPLVARPELLCLAAQALRRPWRVDAGLVVGFDLRPGRESGDMALLAPPDPVSDDAGQGIEAGCSVNAALADLLSEELGDRTLRCGRIIEVEVIMCLALEGRHGHRSGEDIAEFVFERAVVEHSDQPGRAGFGMDGTCDPDRLVGRPEGRVATHLPGDHVPDAADGGDIVVGRRFGQLPVEMQLALTIFGYTA